MHACIGFLCCCCCELQRSSRANNLTSLGEGEREQITLAFFTAAEFIHFYSALVFPMLSPPLPSFIPTLQPPSSITGKETILSQQFTRTASSECAAFTFSLFFYPSTSSFLSLLVPVFRSLSEPALFSRFFCPLRSFR